MRWSLLVGSLCASTVLALPAIDAEQAWPWEPKRQGTPQPRGSEDNTVKKIAQAEEAATEKQNSPWDNFFGSGSWGRRAKGQARPPPRPRPETDSEDDDEEESRWAFYPPYPPYSSFLPRAAGGQRERVDPAAARDFNRPKSYEAGRTPVQSSWQEGGAYFTGAGTFDQVGPALPQSFQGYQNPQPAQVWGNAGPQTGWEQQSPWSRTQQQQQQQQRQGGWGAQVPASQWTTAVPAAPKSGGGFFSPGFNGWGSQSQAVPPQAIPPQAVQPQAQPAAQGYSPYAAPLSPQLDGGYSDAGYRQQATTATAYPQQIDAGNGYQQTQPRPVDDSRNNQPGVIAAGANTARSQLVPTLTRDQSSGPSPFRPMQGPLAPRPTGLGAGYIGDSHAPLAQPGPYGPLQTTQSPPNQPFPNPQHDAFPSAAPPSSTALLDPVHVPTLKSWERPTPTLGYHLPPAPPRGTPPVVAPVAKDPISSLASEESTISQAAPSLTAVSSSGPLGNQPLPEQPKEQPKMVPTMGATSQRPSSTPVPEQPKVESPNPEPPKAVPSFSDATTQRPSSQPLPETPQTTLSTALSRSSALSQAPTASQLPYSQQQSSSRAPKYSPTTNTGLSPALASAISSFSAFADSSKPKPSPGRPVPSMTRGQSPFSTPSPPAPPPPPSTWQPNAVIGGPRSRLWQPAVGAPFQIILSAMLDVRSRLEPANVDIWDIDMFATPKSTIDELHRQRKKVICYFSAGSSEDWRPDYREFGFNDLGSKVAKDAKGRTYWEGERWLNIKNPSYPSGSLPNVWRIMQRRIKMAADKGCDAIDPDNMDGYDNTNGLRLSQQDSINFMKYMSDEALRYNMSTGLKNSLHILSALDPYIQFAVNEECASMQECQGYSQFLTRKPVFHIEYVKRARGSGLGSLFGSGSQAPASPAVPYAPAVPYIPAVPAIPAAEQAPSSGLGSLFGWGQASPAAPQAPASPMGLGSLLGPWAALIPTPGATQAPGSGTRGGRPGGISGLLGSLFGSGSTPRGSGSAAPAPEPAEVSKTAVAPRTSVVASKATSAAQQTSKAKSSAVATPASATSFAAVASAASVASVAAAASKQTPATSALSLPPAPGSTQAPKGTSAADSTGASATVASSMASASSAAPVSTASSLNNNVTAVPAAVESSTSESQKPVDVNPLTAWTGPLNSLLGGIYSGITSFIPGYRSNVYQDTAEPNNVSTRIRSSVDGLGIVPGDNGQGTAWGQSYGEAAQDGPSDRLNRGGRFGNAGSGGAGFLSGLASGSAMGDEAIFQNACNPGAGLGNKFSTVVKTEALDGWVRFCDGRTVVTRVLGSTKDRS